MASPQGQSETFATECVVPSGVPAVVVINGRVLVRGYEDHRLVVAGGIVLSQYVVGDRMAQAHAMVQLVEQAWAEQVEMAKAFGCTTRTVLRYERFEAGGLASGPRTRLVNWLRSEGRSNREIAIRLGA